MNEEVRRDICESYCKYPSEKMNQQELDAICEKCPLNRLEGVNEERDN